MSHAAIEEQLQGFVDSGRVPNILLWGDAGSGKKTLLMTMLNALYGDVQDKDRLIMMVECGYGKGIRFIREELKFFGQSLSGSASVKSVVLLNGDRLTLDAQSALRRCIELYNHSTRFFMVVEDKHKLLSPIISRFCSIHVPRMLVAGREVNLHSIPHDGCVQPPDTVRIAAKVLGAAGDDYTGAATQLYEKGCSVFDMMTIIEKSDVEVTLKYRYLEYVESARTSIDNELVLLFMCVALVAMRPTAALGNMPVL